MSVSCVKRGRKFIFLLIEILFMYVNLYVFLITEANARYASINYTAEESTSGGPVLVLPKEPQSLPSNILTFGAIGMVITLTFTLQPCAVLLMFCLLVVAASFTEGANTNNAFRAAHPVFVSQFKQHVLPTYALSKDKERVELVQQFLRDTQE